MSNKNNQDRLERLDSALRENLKRRRQQAQARGDQAYATTANAPNPKEVHKKDNVAN